MTTPTGQDERSETPEPLVGAIARAWRHEGNTHKVLDKHLVMAIKDEVEKWLERRLRVVEEDNKRLVNMLVGMDAALKQCEEWPPISHSGHTKPQGERARSPAGREGDERSEERASEAEGDPPAAAEGGAMTDNERLSAEQIEEFRAALRAQWMPGLSIAESHRRADALCDMALASLAVEQNVAPQPSTAHDLAAPSQEGVATCLSLQSERDKFKKFHEEADRCAHMHYTNSVEWKKRALAAESALERAEGKATFWKKQADEEREQAAERIGETAKAIDYRWQLEDALEPFAKLLHADGHMNCFHDLPADSVVYENCGHTLTAGDFRRAANVFARKIDDTFTDGCLKRDSITPPPQTKMSDERKGWQFVEDALEMERKRTRHAGGFFPQVAEEHREDDKAFARVLELVRFAKERNMPLPASPQGAQPDGGK